MSERKKYTGIANAFSALPEKTRKHSERVGDYMRVVFAECCYTGVLRNDQKSEARLREDLLDMACRIGLYHNIGKALIPEELHFCSDDFSSEEKALYRKYDDYTKKLIYDYYRSEFKAGAREETYAYETVCSMHEHYDGSGYPEGLEGKKIPVISRILAAVDALDIMSTQVKSDKPFDFAFNYLTEQSGKLFDKNVVDVMKASKASLLKIYKQYQDTTEQPKKVTKLIPASGKRAVALEYRTVNDKDYTTVALEARPKFRFGNEWTDFETVSYLFDDAAIRKNICLYLIGEACDLLRQAEASYLSFNYVLLNLPAGSLKLQGLGQEIIDLLRDEEIDTKKIRINAEAELFTKTTSALDKNIKLLTSAGIGVMMSGVCLSDESAENPERVTMTPEQVIETGINFFRIDRQDENDADCEEGINRFLKLRESGIEITADNLESQNVKATLDILEVKDFTGDAQGAYTDPDTLLQKEIAAKAAS